MGTEVAGRYRVLRMLGEGGSSWVYEVEHLRTARHHALKVLRPELAARPGSVERFRREARAAAELGSRHIVGALDLGSLDDGRPFILLELLAGETLRERLRRETRLPIPTAVEIALQCCRALETAHARGVIHRDLKPENLHLSVDAAGSLVVKVLDFGISKLTEEARDLASGSLTRTGVAIGTPWYMPPEQLDGSHQLDHRADVYALGVVLHEMLVGRRPFEAPTLTTLVLKIAAEAPPRLRALRPDAGVALEQVVRRAMAKRAHERFATIGDMAAALRAALVERPRHAGLSLRAVAPALALAAMAPLALVSGGDPAESSSSSSAAVPSRLASPRRPPARPAAPAPSIVPAAGAHPRARAPAATRFSAEPVERRAPTIAALHRAIRAPAGDPPDRASSVRTGPAAPREPGRVRLVPPGAATPSAPARTVVLRNERRARAHLVLRCGAETLERTLPAASSAPVSLPPEPCRVRCTGVGEPVCASLLPASATSITVR